MRNFLLKQFADSIEVKKSILSDEGFITKICSIAEVAVSLYKSNNKILLAGNGGSAADAQHIAGELVSKFYFDRDALPAIALTTDTSILTAIGNDYGYDRVFARQIHALGNKGDMFIGISTSGKSPNILSAFEVARSREMITVGLTGWQGGNLTEICDFCLQVPSTETPRIQEAHILIGHVLCSIIEESLFGRGY